MTYQHIYLDLDRTLLDTPRFSEAVIVAFEQTYSVPAKDFQGQMPQFYVRHGDMQYYDFYGHARMLGHDPHEVAERLRPMLAGQDFLYPDARDLVEKLKHAPVQASVLSYGPENYQGFKFSLLSELHHLPFVATLQFKQDFLVDQPQVPSLLVDDKIVSPLPTWCSQFLIDRSAAAPKSPEGEHVWRINSLQVVVTELSLEYNERNEKGTTDEAD
jgi:hypothetical protein